MSEKRKHIFLPRTLVNKILGHAQSAPESEVCGLVSCNEQTSSYHLYPVENVARDKTRLFEMDAKQLIEAMRQFRDSNETLFAIYHSHPHAPATPSIVDIQQANYPDSLYLIISLNTVGVLEMQGFYIRAGAVEEVELEVMEAAD